MTLTDPFGPTLGSETVTYEYQAGRLWRKITPLGTIIYNYDTGGNLASIKVPHSSGSTFDYSVAYNWDALNRLDQVDDANDTVIPTRYTYDAAGNLGAVANPNGVTTTYNYNSLNRLTDMSAASTAGTLATFNYNPSETGRTLGASGNRRAARETLQLPDGGVIARNVNYDYDRLYRLTKEDIALDTANTDSTRAHGTVTYDATPGYSDLASGLGYDRVGNRHSRSLSGANSALSSKVPDFYGRKYDRNDWVDGNSDATDANGNYDDNGNTRVVSSDDLTSGAILPTSGHEDKYDFENRLIQRQSGDGISTITTITLAYDGDGNRVRKTVAVTVSGTTTTTKTDYLVDERNPTGYAQVLEEIETVNTGTPTLKRQYVYGHSLISETLVGDTHPYHYYGTDGHGNVRFLTDYQAQITDAYNYDAFGILLDGWNSGSATPNLYLYSSEQWDSDLGLYYLRARYYCQDTGRFWTMDTYDGDQEDPLSLHKYLYCDAAPTDGFDPLGLYTQKEGYAVEAQIRMQYSTEHPGQDVGNGGQIGVGKNPRLRPDIWNKSSSPKTFAEIKPLSESGVARGIVQLNNYDRSLSALGYSRDKWPGNPPLRRCFVGTQPYFYFNIHGLILYTKLKPPFILPVFFPQAKKLAAVNAEKIIAGPQTTLEDVVGEEVVGVEVAETAGIGADAGVATLTTVE